MISINARTAAVTPQQQPADSRSRLEKLLESMQQVNKELKSLYKRWRDATNVAERMALRHQIEALEDMLKAMREEIVRLTQEQQKQHRRSESSAAAQNADHYEDPGIYYPPDETVKVEEQAAKP